MRLALGERDYIFGDLFQPGEAECKDGFARSTVTFYYIVEIKGLAAGWLYVWRICGPGSRQIGAAEGTKRARNGSSAEQLSFTLSSITVESNIRATL